MKAVDLPELDRRLSELADAFGTRPPSKGALNVWLDALKECQFDDVKSVLSDWPKSHAKAPLPAEVLKACRTMMSERIERQAEINRQTAPTIADLVEGLKRNLSPESKKAREEIAARLASANSKVKDHKAWAKKLKARDESGEQLLECQRNAWREALKHEDHVA